MSVVVTSGSAERCPLMYDGVTPVKDRFCPLMTSACAPSVKLVASADAVHGRSPARVSVIVTPRSGRRSPGSPKAALAVNSESPAFSAAVPSWNGLDGVYGVVMVSVPAGMPTSTVCASGGRSARWP